MAACIFYVFGHGSQENRSNTSAVRKTIATHRSSGEPYQHNCATKKLSAETVSFDANACTVHAATSSAEERTLMRSEFIDDDAVTMRRAWRFWNWSSMIQWCWKPRWTWAGKGVNSTTGNNTRDCWGQRVLAHGPTIAETWLDAIMRKENLRGTNEDVVRLFWKMNKGLN